MSVGSHERHLDRSRDERSLERRRWFEHSVMVPVSFGMVFTFIAIGVTRLATALGAPVWISDRSWPTLIIVLIAGATVVAVRALRR